MNMLKTSWHLWWGWYPDKVENWLEDMELKGWNLYQVNMWGIRFKFKKEESKKVRYCVDYQPTIDADYIKLFNDDGWQLIWNDDFGWYIWKKVYDKIRPSIYTDSSSLIDRSNRLVKVFQPVFFFLISIFVLLILPRRNEDFFSLLFWIYIGILTMYGVFFYQIKKHNKKLKKNNIKE